MIKLENTEVLGWEAAIRGMRNPMNSWERSDGQWLFTDDDAGVDYVQYKTGDPASLYFVGENDHDLMMRLSKGGPVHAKYRRMITVYVDITAPLYWWKEFDTYKVGTVANSCSTMHKIAAKEFTLEDFSCEHLIDDDNEIQNNTNHVACSSGFVIKKIIIDTLNHYRNKYLDTKDKKYWWQMIQLLPSSYNQKRTVMLNYEVLANIHKSRRNHKLDEWHTFCDWIEELPYSELITGEISSDTQISQEVISESTPLFLKNSLILKEGDK